MNLTEYSKAGVWKSLMVAVFRVRQIQSHHLAFECNNKIVILTYLLPENFRYLIKSTQRDRFGAKDKQASVY